MRHHSSRIILGASLAGAFAISSIAASAETTNTKPVTVANTPQASDPAQGTGGWVIIQPERKDAKGFSIVKPGEMADNFGGVSNRLLSQSHGVGSGGIGGGNLSPTARMEMPKF